MEFITSCDSLTGQVKRRYSDFIVEEVYEKNGKDMKCAVKRFNVPFEERGEIIKTKIPENNEEKEHLIVELEKINTDINKAISLISRGTGVSRKRMGYAGMKDKRAITAQRISIFKPSLDKIVNFGVKGLELRNPRWGERIEIGELKGNEFTIVIRDVDKTEEEIKKIVECFEKESVNGVPNFFGNQRFGGKRLVTHKVGKLLLQEKSEEAIMTYLTETYEEEKEDIKNARINLAKTKDFKQALKEFPNFCRQEKALLNRLVIEPNNYLGALNALPKKLRFLFVHAYQSYLFNKIIQKRIELYKKDALKAIEGDILENGLPTGLLPGFESSFAKGKAGEIEKQILEEEGITLEQFKVRTQSELSSKGNRKPIVLFGENFKLKKIEDDAFFEGKKAVTISFYLSKGNYATTFLRELLKEEIF